ncbi:MAG: hypothetical protein AB7J34_22105, partial [Limisphaerales bacterium]
QTAPVIKLPAEATEDDHLRLLGILNSSTACFWLKQVCQNKGSTVDMQGARQRTAAFEDFYQFNATKLKEFPVPQHYSLALVRELNRLASAFAKHRPEYVLNNLSSLNDLPVNSSREAWIRVLRNMISLQEELDWECYRLYGLIEEELALPADEVPGVKLGERAFEIVLARRMAAGEEKTEWFERHGSTPITEIPTHWPEPYRKLVERRIQVIQDNANIRLIERPEYKRRWNLEPWDEQLVRALREWLLRRLETYFFGGERMAEDPVTPSEAGGRDDHHEAHEGHEVGREREYGKPSVLGSGGEGTGNRTPREFASSNPESAESTSLRDLRGCPSSPSKDPVAALRAAWAGGTQPTVVSTHRLAECARADADFMQVAELYRKRPDFDVAALVAELVEEESVPFLPVQRYKESGLRHRLVWEEVWDLQRREDAVEAEVRASQPTDDEQALAAEIRQRQREVVGEIPVPPKYKSADFKKTTYWRLRGKLDVPKERWVSFPGCEWESDPSLPIAWAGWDHLQQAQALAAYLEDLKGAGASDAKQLLVLAGLQQLVPWLLQWHNDVHPDFGMRLGDYFRAHVRDELQRLGKTEAELKILAYGPGI